MRITLTGAPTGKRMQYSGTGGGTTSSDAVYTYDTAGRLASLKYPGQTAAMTYAYDSMGRPLSMYDPNVQTGLDVNGDPIYGLTRAQSAAYDLAGRLTSFQYHTFIDTGSTAHYTTESLTYNVNGQMDSMGWTGLGSGTRGLAYSYSSTANNGQITQVSDTLSGETIVYQYDALKRLMSAAATGRRRRLGWRRRRTGCRARVTIRTGI